MYGITLNALDEKAFWATRHNNHNFWLEDQARVYNEMVRDDYVPGGHIKEFVQMYIKLLKEVGTTRENPCLKYKTISLKSEELDLSIFDDEEECLADLKEKYGSGGA